MDIFSSEVQASFHNLLLTNEKLWEPEGAANEPYLSSLLTSRFVLTLLSELWSFQRALEFPASSEVSSYSDAQTASPMPVVLLLVSAPKSLQLHMKVNQ